MSLSAILTLGVVLAVSAVEPAEPPIMNRIPPDAEARELLVKPGLPYDRKVGYFVKDPLFPNRRENKVASRYYYPNGKLYEEHFCFTDPVGCSILHGLRRQWLPNGQLHRERYYRMDQLHGSCKQWNPEGKLLGTFEMKKGSGTEPVWWNNGKLEEEKEYRNGSQHGRSRSYTEEGVLKSEIWYNEGKSHGPATYFGEVIDSSESDFFFLGGKEVSRKEFSKAQNEGKLISPCGRRSYYIQGKQVSHKEYLEARRSDPTLPPAE